LAGPIELGDGEPQVLLDCGAGGDDPRLPHATGLGLADGFPEDVPRFPKPHALPNEAGCELAGGCEDPPQALPTLPEDGAEDEMPEPHTLPELPAGGAGKLPDPQMLGCEEEEEEDGRLDPEPNVADGLAPDDDPHPVLDARGAGAG